MGRSKSKTAGGVGNKINKEIVAWTGVGITVVLASIILLKFKDVSGVTSDLNTTIDSFVTAFAEPKNWVAIVIIAIIGFALLKFYKGKK